MHLKGRRRRILRSRFFLLIPTCVPLFNNLNHITIKNTHVRITIGSIPFGTTTTQNISGLILYQHIRPPSARTTFFVCNKFSSANLFWLFFSFLTWLKLKHSVHQQSGKPLTLPAVNGGRLSLRCCCELLCCSCCCCCCYKFEILLIDTFHFFGGIGRREPARRSPSLMCVISLPLLWQSIKNRQHTHTNAPISSVRRPFSSVSCVSFVRVIFRDGPGLLLPDTKFVSKKSEQ